MPIDPNTGVYFETHGSGAPLLIAFPIMASHGAVFGVEEAVVRDRFLDHFIDRYQVLLVDYPSIGKSADIPPSELTADRVCADLLSAASAAGFNQFAYWGYSWGAAVGLQLSLRTERLSALVMGGWPPLGADYGRILSAAEAQVSNPPKEVQIVLRSPKQYAQWATFYRSIDGFSEREVSLEKRFPRLAYVGAEGDVGAGAELIRNAAIMKENRETLEAAGWRVVFIEGEDHGVGLKPEIVCPIVRSFLDENLLS